MSEGIWYLLVYTKSPFYSSIFLKIQLGAFRSSSSFCVRLRRPFRALFWEGLYTTLLCGTKPLARRAQPVQSAGWGCSLFKMLSTGNWYTGGVFYLDFEPGFGSVYATWRLFVRPSPTNLLKMGWFYLLNYLFLCMPIMIYLWACALASLVGQGLWLTPALPPNRPWHEFIQSASSLSPGAGALASLVWQSMWICSPTR